ncbi:Prolyl tripeptidyl peptidase precursor [Chryseobacterium indoltheticum]|uniref:Prolyl tripeptidyl peptidase n=1 Tax=Chryseobacterium indoltheticum TaxID=254 RepID=A0A381FIY4_9FLAO|nr:Prolyl tripeptidyl peptidase precursor [Chryseobacterium indoltheticum]
MASAHIYHLADGKKTKVNLDQFKNYYIPNVIQTSNADEIVLITSQRTQNASDVLKVNTKTGEVKKLFTETDDKWIDTDNVSLEFLEDNSFLWASERDGFRHLYWYDKDGKLKKQVTKGNWEVTEYYGYNPKSQEIFVQTTEKGSINKVISKINIQNGKSQLISNAEGNNSANFSKNYSYFIETSSTAANPYTFVLKDGNGKKLKELQNNDDQLKNYRQINSQ